MKYQKVSSWKDLGQLADTLLCCAFCIYTWQYDDLWAKVLQALFVLVVLLELYPWLKKQFKKF